MKMILINNLKAPYKKRMVDSNIKVKAWLFSMPPIESCLNNASCKSSCYAIKAYRQYPNVKALWGDNLDKAKNNLDQLYNDLDTQCQSISKQKKHKRVIRIHQSGDFISTEYINLWYKLALKYTNILFYGYTKVLKHNNDFNVSINKLHGLKNANIISSLIGDTNRKNYGSMEYCKKVSEKTGAVICPVNSENENQNIHCGLARATKYNKKGATFCDHCMKNSNIVFVQH